jgi:beta-xylosidase
MTNDASPLRDCRRQSLVAAAAATILLVSAVGYGQQTGYWGDQGDGSFRNPVLAADYSDPDVVRVGNDYYMVASSFESSPGIPVLHSRDLVNWTTIGAVFSDTSKLGPEMNWDRMGRYKLGLYAPSIRYHDGKFWVFVNSNSDEGFLMATAKDAAGPWTVNRIKDKHGKPLRVPGWTDPCPFWDTDGKAYLATSHPRGDWFGYLFQMTPDGTQLLDGDFDTMSLRTESLPWPDGGTVYSPFHSTEGNKIYQHDGFYYLQHIEFTDKGHGHGTYFLRSRHLYGTKPDGTSGRPGNPGEYEIFSADRVSGAGQTLPGQGALVDTPDGRWFWVAQFNRYGSDGRTPNLLPVTWVNQWPVIGVDIRDNHGAMAWQLPKPIAGQPIEFPQGNSDSFNTPHLSPEWEWNHQPRADHWSLTERPGFLRLHAFPPAKPGFFSAGNTLAQRHLRSASTVITIEIELDGFADGQDGGLAHFNSGLHYATLGVVQKGPQRTLQYTEDGKATVSDMSLVGVRKLWLRSSAGFDDLNHYSFSLDGSHFTDFGETYKLRVGNYRGDMVGIYTFNPLRDAGFMDVKSFTSMTAYRPVR